MAGKQTSIALTKKSKALLLRLEREHGAANVREGIRKFFDRQALFAAAHIQKTQLSGQKLQNRTGQLRASIMGRGEMVGSVPAIRVGIFRGPALKYAGVQEYGTRGKNPDSPYDTIRPKTAKSLAVPIGDALTPAGVARYQSPRDYPEELVPIVGAGISRGRFVGMLVTKASVDMAGPDADARSLNAVYLLLRAVDIAPKFYLRDGFAEFLPMLSERLGRHLANVVAGKSA